MRTAWFLVVLGACKSVYDAQYDDRATELEAFRSLFPTDNSTVNFISGSDTRFYWLATDTQTSKQLLHSFEPATSTVVDYQVDLTSERSFDKFHFSDHFLAICDFDVIELFDLSSSAGTKLPTLDGTGSSCAVDGDTIYYAAGNTAQNGQGLYRSINGAAATQIIDLQPSFNDDTGVEGIGVVAPGELVIAENGNIWHVVVNGSTLTYLMNPKTGNGAFAFDGKRIVYPTATGVVFQAYDELAPHDLVAAIKDGGYSLNFEHGDVQELDTDTDDYWVAQDHLIYRSKHGIFAYGFDSGKVVDLLLDRDGEFEPKPFYRLPTPVANTLFVQDLNFDGSDHPVYSVDVSGRLR